MKLSSPIIFQRRCDASAGIALSTDSWVGANDEDNALQLYSTNGGTPLSDTFLDLNEFLKISGEPDKLEADLESGTRIGDVIWWIGSHSQSRKGKDRPNRHRLFATRIDSAGATISLQPHGVPCTSLREVMITDSRLKKFALENGVPLPPKEPGGFNIEAICADPTGQRLWVGMRNPIPKDGALLVPVEDLSLLLKEGKPVLGDPVQLDLGGLGFRDMICVDHHYLVLAGDFRDRADPKAVASQLFRWGGPGEKAIPIEVAFGTLNPEALILFPDRRVLVISDDGTQPCEGGLICKDPATPAEKRVFRGVWLTGFWPFT
jgi:hypothetical protein